MHLRVDRLAIVSIIKRTWLIVGKRLVFPHERQVVMAYLIQYFGKDG